MAHVYPSLIARACIWQNSPASRGMSSVDASERMGLAATSLIALAGPDLAQHPRRQAVLAHERRRATRTRGVGHVAPILDRAGGPCAGCRRGRAAPPRS